MTRYTCTISRYSPSSAPTCTGASAPSRSAARPLHHRVAIKPPYAHSGLRLCVYVCVCVGGWVCSQHNKDLGFLMNPGDGAVPCIQFYCPPDAHGAPSHMFSGSADGSIAVWQAGGQWQHLKLMKVCHPCAHTRARTHRHTEPHMLLSRMLLLACVYVCTCVCVCVCVCVYVCIYQPCRVTRRQSTPSLSTPQVVWPCQLHTIAVCVCGT